MLTRPIRARQHQHGQLPSDRGRQEPSHVRNNPRENPWPKAEHLLDLNPGLESRAVFDVVQRRFPGRLRDSQTGILGQTWASDAAAGPVKNGQVHLPFVPGHLGISNFLPMDDLRIIVAGHKFDHMIHYFILPYSCWETGTVCLSENFECLSHALQDAFWELQGVPEMHGIVEREGSRNPLDGRTRVQRQYGALLAHYTLKARAIDRENMHENDVAHQHEIRFKRSLEEALRLRGSRVFVDRAAYERFLRKFFAQRNVGRAERVAAERMQLRDLPTRRVDAGDRWRVRVTRASTIRIRTNTYTVPSELIGALVDIYFRADCLEVRRGEELVVTLPRIHGQNQRQINPEHVIGWLASTPRAFAKCPYRDAFFPTSRFRQAYDVLHSRFPLKAREMYFGILSLADKGCIAGVDAALGELLEWGVPITTLHVQEHLRHVERMRQARKAANASTNRSMMISSVAIGTISETGPGRG